MIILLSLVRRIRILVLNNLPWVVERRQLLREIERFEAQQDARLAALMRRAEGTLERQSDESPDRKEA